MCCRRRLGLKINKSGTGALFTFPRAAWLERDCSHFVARMLSVSLLLHLDLHTRFPRIHYIRRRKALITPISDALGRHRHLLWLQVAPRISHHIDIYCRWIATHTLVLTCSYCCHHGSYRHITRRSSIGRVHDEHASRLEARARAVSTQALCRG